MTMALDRIENSFLAIGELDRRFKENKKVGWLYILSNPSFANIAYKVGQTSKPPHLRTRELSSSTAVYKDFTLVYFVHVSDRVSAEKDIHAVLSSRRVSHRKEFFDAPISKIVAAMDSVAERYYVISKRAKSLILQQPLGTRIVSCRSCGTKNRVKELLIPVAGSCGACGGPVEMPRVEIAAWR